MLREPVLARFDNGVRRPRIEGAGAPFRNGKRLRLSLVPAPAFWACDGATVPSLPWDCDDRSASRRRAAATSTPVSEPPAAEAGLTDERRPH
jgi:hypothetical protein